MVCDLWYLKDLEEKDCLVNQFINHKDVYRPAPATPGLSITQYLTPKLDYIEEKKMAKITQANIQDGYIQE